MLTNDLLSDSIEQLGLIHNFVANPYAVQKDTLLHILSQNNNTHYGKEFSFEKITKIEDFQNTIPINNYETICSWLENYDEKKNILSEDPIIYWGKTTGSSSDPKYIPLTETSLEFWNLGIHRNLYAFLNQFKNINLDSTNLKVIFSIGPSFLEIYKDIPVGYISGITNKCSAIADNLNVVPDNIEYKDFEDSLFQISKKAITENIFCLVGITTFSINILHYIKYKLASRLSDYPEYKELMNKVADENNIIDINKLWPNLKFFISTGIVLDEVRDQLNTLVPGLWIADAYTGTEGAYAFTLSPSAPGLVLNLDLYFFEFRDIETNEIFTIEDVQLHTRYEIILTSINGLYRYPNGDIIEFTSISPHYIKVLGRTSTVVNFTGEKLTETQIHTVINKTLNTFNLTSNGFIFWGWIDEQCFVHYFIAVETVENTCTTNLDDFSKTIQKNISIIQHDTEYELSYQSLIKDPHIIILKPGTIKNLEHIKASKAGFLGHTKLKKIITFNEALDIIKLDYILQDNLPDYLKNKFTAH